MTTALLVTIKKGVPQHIEEARGQLCAQLSLSVLTRAPDGTPVKGFILLALVEEL